MCLYMYRERERKWYAVLTAAIVFDLMYLPVDPEILYINFHKGDNLRYDICLGHIMVL